MKETTCHIFYVKPYLLQKGLRASLDEEMKAPGGEGVSRGHRSFDGLVFILTQKLQRAEPWAGFQPKPTAPSQPTPSAPWGVGQCEVLPDLTGVRAGLWAGNRPPWSTLPPPCHTINTI